MSLLTTSIEDDTCAVLSSFKLNKNYHQHNKDLTNEKNNLIKELIIIRINKTNKMKYFNITKKTKSRKQNKYR